MNPPTRKDTFLNATLLGIALLLVVQTALDGNPASGEAAHADASRGTQSVVAVAQ
jgi:hypothetical protein